MADTDKSEVDETLNMIWASQFASQPPTKDEWINYLKKFITQQCTQARIDLLKNIKAQSHIVDTDLGERYELSRPMDFDYMICQLERQAKEMKGEA